MTESEKIIILDFGSQYTQLIARKVRELKVYCEIHPFNDLPELDLSVKGIILSGSPSSVCNEGSPRVDLSQFSPHLPILGVCYGAQMMVHLAGGIVEQSNIREYGRANLRYVDPENDLLEGVPQGSQVWMSHGDTIQQLPSDFEVIASTETVSVAAFQVKDRPHYGLQFHPEVAHSLDGLTLLRNFLVRVCNCKQNWTAAHFVEETVQEIKKAVGDEKVVMGLSGGVDSSVAAMLIDQAIGDQLHCIFVNNGLLRKEEYDEVLHSYRDMGLNITGVDATDEFMSALKGIVDPEQKRKAVGRTFIEVFDREAHRIQDVKWLGQGTIYPDVIESVNVKGPSATIKSHHNVGGLPAEMNLKVLEPLNTLFKDEVRRVGQEMALPAEILQRHPFPGPGLSIRILGEVTYESVRVLQEADHIFIHSLKKEGLYDEVWQAGAILLPVRSVGVMGDERTYENVVALRAVVSTDGMTADWAHLPHGFLSTISNQIINKVKGINRVVYDISSKPPATIEWE